MISTLSLLGAALLTLLIVSVFGSLEHAALTASTPNFTPTKTFARYSLAGSPAAAVGAIASAMPELIGAEAPQRLFGIQLMFVLYAGIGVIVALLYRALPQDEDGQNKQEGSSALGPSKSIVLRLALLFSLDSFAGGFVAQSLLALWLLALRPVIVRGGRVLFLDGHPLRVIVSCGRMALHEDRPREHDGVHSHPLKHRPHPSRDGAKSPGRHCPPARAGRPVPDGCSNPLVLRHGGGHPAGTRHCGQLYRCAAQSRG